MTDKVLIAKGLESEGRLASSFRESGIQVMTAYDAVHLVNQARQYLPGLVVVSDQLLGGAIAAIRAIRSHVNTARTPILAVQQVDGGFEGAATAAGAQACVRWPVGDAQLFGAARRCVEMTLSINQAPDSVLNDAQRMADLEETGLLDSPPSEAFDRLTRLASRLAGAPISIVSLVDRNRQFFKSSIGFGPPLSETRQTNLSHSFCQWVVSSGEPLVIADANQHPVLRDNGAVRELGVVAYAGVPLFGRRNQPIGSLCVVDGQPHNWTEFDVELLNDLAAVIKALATSRAAHAHGSQPEAWPPGWVRVIAEGAMGAVRVMRRYGERIQAQDRRELLDVIEYQTALLLDPAMN